MFINYRTHELMCYVLSVQFGIYVVVAGGFFLFWYVWLGEKGQKISPKMPKPRETIREILFSLVSIFIFALCICVPMGNKYFVAKLSRCDWDDTSRGWLDTLWSIPIVVILHDTYFYFCHRLMHTKFLYKHVHYIHHLGGGNTSPLSVFLLHPIEAFENGLFFTLTLMLVPSNWKLIATYFLVMILQNAYSHLGYEIFPKNWHRHWIGRWINTSVAHYLHHSGRHGQGNFSFYFLFWDKLMGTEIPHYDLTTSTSTSTSNSNGKIR